MAAHDDAAALFDAAVIGAVALGDHDPATVLRTLDPPPELYDATIAAIERAARGEIRAIAATMVAAVAGPRKRGLRSSSEVFPAVELSLRVLDRADREADRLRFGMELLTLREG